MYRNDVKELLAQSLQRLLEKKTLEKINVQEITRDCQVSRSTFYRQFLDKYDLMNYCYQVKVDKFLKELEYNNCQNILTYIFYFLKEDKNFFENAIRTKGENSFLNFLYDYSFDFYKKEFLTRSKKDKLSNKETACIAFNCAGAVRLVEGWIKCRMKQSPEEAVLKTRYRLIPLIW
ncbi:MAG TPA: TetR/AcrR family transcriptional regulator C-terminal domain-containing protein [Anaerovoracaceae bacterium]|nr:TetR/AcrR family transcriptional regulator C-terminal domain-containing protein [Anaerovoracaceae bacterium]